VKKYHTSFGSASLSGFRENTKTVFILLSLLDRIIRIIRYYAARRYSRSRQTFVADRSFQADPSIPRNVHGQ